MRCLLHVSFVAGEADGHQGFARLLLDIPFAPWKGLVFEQPVWHQGQAAAKVSWNVDEKSFYVVFTPHSIESKDNRESTHEMYRLHGWTINKTPDLITG